MSDIKKHEEMTKEYKAALAEKEAKKLREAQDRKNEQIRQRQAAAKARREAEAKKKELQAELAGKKIAECNARIEKAKKILDSESAYNLVGRIALWFFCFMIVVIVTMFFVGLDADSILIPMFIAMGIIGISIFFQTRAEFAKKMIRDNTNEITKIRRELYAAKKR